MLRFVVFIVLLLGSCFPKPSTKEKVQVVATNSIIGDVVREIGGDAIELFVLLPPGVDPHSYEPSPQDLIKASQARIIFINGAGLEEVFLKRLLENASPDALIVDLSEGIELLPFEGESHEEHEHEFRVDPHVWFDPINVITWTQHIALALGKVDSQNAKLYQKKASDYERRLLELDTWIKEKVEGVPPERRKLVTDHMAFGYFARRYGFQQVGTIIPGVTTLAEPSAQDIAELIELIKEEKVPAIFVSASASPKMAEQIAQDTGIKVIPLYIESLSQPGGPASTYFELMRYNVSAIVEALK
ncbi:MAG: metal ABC transporter substrate-binding protein [Anaerolineae bacterium]|nr:metal ABC transporter substrate-binding protein [Anaerolineae bacterium]MDW8102564.1 metal ABC transporter substrate-binding protein [Anaerolineae bacterium]